MSIGFGPGHLFQPPQGGASVQQPQRATVTATPVSVTDSRLVAALQTPPSGYVWVVTRITLAAIIIATVNSFPKVSETVPGGVVGPAQLRLDSQVIDTTDDGSSDTWNGQIIVASNSTLDVLWPGLSTGGNWADTATAVFEFLQVAA